MRYLLALLLLSGCWQQMTFQAYGDSITAGVAATTGNGYVKLLESALGVTISNLAVSGDQAADTAIKAHSAALTAADKATLLIGTNDQWKYGTNTAKQAMYRAFLLDSLVSLAAPAKGAITWTGSWTTSQPNYADGKWSYTANDTAVATVSGTAVYIGVILQDLVSGVAVNGTADVYVDGTTQAHKVGSISSNGSGMTTQNGAAHAPATFRFGGLSAGSHTVTVKVTSAQAGIPGLIYLERIVGSDQLAKPSVYVSTIPRYSAQGYAALGGSDANMAAYNAIVTAERANLSADGLNVILVDSSATLNQTTDLETVTPFIHPVNAGHVKLKTAFYSAIYVPSQYSTAEVVVDNATGVYYARKLDGSNLRQVSQ